MAKKIPVFQCALCREPIYRTGEVDSDGDPKNTHVPPGFEVTAGNLTNMVNWEYLSTRKRLDTIHVPVTIDEYKAKNRRAKGIPEPVEHVNNVVSMEQFRKNKDQS